MLYWKADFNIPNSAVQAAEVFAKAEIMEDGLVRVVFYSDQGSINMLWEKEFELVTPVTDRNVYDKLLQNEYFANYSKV